MVDVECSFDRSSRAFSHSWNRVAQYGQDRRNPDSLYAVKDEIRYIKLMHSVL